MPMPATLERLASRARSPSKWLKRPSPTPGDRVPASFRQTWCLKPASTWRTQSRATKRDGAGGPSMKLAMKK